MSEIVVRMGIPVNCDKCDLRNGCKLYVDYSWSLSDCFPTRPKPNPLDRGCLIICFLPEGHGRLVDMNDVEGMFEAAQIISDDDCNCGYVTDDLQTEKLPTIVPAERNEE